MDKILDGRLKDLEGLEEDYPDQLKDLRRHEILERAIDLADGILVDYSDGEIEELDWLTAKIAERFTDKVVLRLSHCLLRKDLESRKK